MGKVWRWYRGRRGWLQIVIAVVLVLVIVGIANSGNSSSKGSSPSTNSNSSTNPSSSTNPPPPAAGSPSQVKGIVEDPGTFTYRSSQCSGTTCVVNVKQGETAFGSEHEVIEPMFPVFKGLFGSKHYRWVEIVAYGPVTSVGGKTSTQKTASVRCTKAANQQINWDAIDMNGIHALCQEQQFVGFSK